MSLKINKIFTIALAMIFAIVFGSVCFASNNPWGTYNCNLFAGSGVSSLSFSYATNSVSPNGMFGYTGSQQGKNYQLTITPNDTLSTSSTVGQFFQANCTGQALGTHSPGSVVPNELYFAFTGTLYINGTPYNCVMGMGKSGAYNNWWFGGTSFMGAHSSGTLYTSDNKYQIQPSGDYGFKVSVN